MKKIICISILFLIFNYIAFANSDLNSKDLTMVSKFTVVKNKKNNALKYFDLNGFISELKQNLIKGYNILENQNGANELYESINNLYEEIEKLKNSLDLKTKQLNVSNVSKIHLDIEIEFKNYAAIIQSNVLKTTAAEENLKKIDNELKKVNDLWKMPEYIMQQDIMRINSNRDLEERNINNMLAKIRDIENNFKISKKNLVLGYTNLSNLSQKSIPIVTYIKDSFETEYQLGFTNLILHLDNISLIKQYSEHRNIINYPEQREHLAAMINEYKKELNNIKTYMKNMNFLSSSENIDINKNDWSNTIEMLQVLRTSYEGLEQSIQLYYKRLWLVLCSSENSILFSDEQVDIYRKDLKTGQYVKHGYIPYKKRFTVKDSFNFEQEFVLVTIVDSLTNLHDTYISIDSLYKVKKN